MLNYSNIYLINFQIILCADISQGNKHLNFGRHPDQIWISFKHGCNSKNNGQRFVVICEWDLVQATDRIYMM